MVIIKAHTILPATPHFTARIPLSVPTPTIAPVIVCVVLIGTPMADAPNRTSEAAPSAQNPSTGRSFESLLPIVLTMRQPPDIVPRTIVAWQVSTIQSGMWNSVPR